MTCNIPHCLEPKLPGKSKCRVHWNEYVRDWYRISPRGKISKRRTTLAQYDLTLEEYETLLIGQGGVCAICGEEELDKELSVDHCHRTGKVRGLLCGKCNHLLGFAKDDPHRLFLASCYLESHLDNSLVGML